MKSKMFSLKALAMPLLILTLYGCSNNSLTESVQPGRDAMTRSLQNCALSISAQVETTTWVEPLDPTDTDLLERQDEVLSLPKTVKCHFESCIESNGHRKEVIQMLPPEYPITYPDDAAGGSSVKAFDRAEVDGNSVTFYDESGDVIHSDVTEGEVEFYTSIIDGLSEFQALTPEGMDMLIDVLVEKGFQIQEPEGGNIFFLTHTYEDGSSSKVILDKNYQTIRGQENYDNSGELESSHYFKMEGPADQPIITGHSYTTTFESPFSEVKLAIRRHSIISNFTLN